MQDFFICAVVSSKAVCVSVFYCPFQNRVQNEQIVIFFVVVPSIEKLSMLFIPKGVS